MLHNTKEKGAPMTTTLEKLREDEEEWRPIVGFEHRYDVSSHGRIRSVERTVIVNNGTRGSYEIKRPSRIIKTGVNHRGYKQFTFHLPGKKNKCLKVHICVAEAFIGPRPSIDHQVHHIDHVKANN